MPRLMPLFVMLVNVICEHKMQAILLTRAGMTELVAVIMYDRAVIHGLAL